MGCSASVPKSKFEKNSSTVKEINIDANIQRDSIDTKAQQPLKINCANLETESLKLKEEINDQKCYDDIEKENNEVQVFNENVISKESFDNGESSNKEHCQNGSHDILNDDGDVLNNNSAELTPNNCSIESTLVETCNNGSSPVENNFCNNESLPVENDSCNNESSTVETCNNESSTVENNSCNNDDNDDLEIITCQNEEIQQTEMVPSEETNEQIVETCYNSIEQ
ncbi:probable basic-leucine zipper transcription factor S isoform X2 [Hydra vulgaris]|uniref:Probable basic-leucine zipper transcription factor S isoform X2 n=1 Tax=Hydra vulgaris TaxID=6087 RepID=A0ABM4D7E2_HYDVU